jgi:hypothetical protein
MRSGTGLPVKHRMRTSLDVPTSTGTVVGLSGQLKSLATCGAAELMLQVIRPGPLLCQFAEMPGCDEAWLRDVEKSPIRQVVAHDTNGFRKITRRSDRVRHSKITAIGASHCYRSNPAAGALSVMAARRRQGCCCPLWSYTKYRSSPSARSGRPRRSAPRECGPGEGRHRTRPP